MLRENVLPDYFHTRQAGTLPDRYGLRVTEIAEGRMQMQMELQPWMMAPNGFLHAASVIVLADSCAGYATIAHLPEGAKGFTTIELKSNFLGTATSGMLRTECLA
ncbi:MAG TPA: PaaI family thioesterase, partial [Burkholderiaceae bacterium]|nr:PaaI family thioesterase [Burkholderiaceae bacterium]